jgi:hypothetical protein
MSSEKPFDLAGAENPSFRLALPLDTENMILSLGVI